jgi:hypothetical protein
MSPEGYNGSHGDAPRDESWSSDPFQQDDDPFRPRPPLRDPFEPQPLEPQPLEPQPDPFASPDDPFGLDDPFRATGPPFDPRRDFIDPFQPEGETAAPPPHPFPAPPPLPLPPTPPPRQSHPPPDADPFAPTERPYPSAGPGVTPLGPSPFDQPGQAFPGGAVPPPGPVPPAPAPQPPVPPADAYGAADQRGQAPQAPIPSRAARHQAKRRMPWRPARGPSGAPPARPPSGAGPTDNNPSAGGPTDNGATLAGPVAGGPAAGDSVVGDPVVGGPADDGAFGGGPAVGGPAGGGSAVGGPAVGDSPFDPFDPFEPAAWHAPGQSAPSLWPASPSTPQGNERRGPPEHIEPFGPVGTAERIGPVTPNGSAIPEAPPRRGRAPAPPRLRPAIPKLEIPSGLARSSLALAAVLIVAALGLGTVSNALPKAHRPPTPAAAPPYSARWVCPLLPGQATSVGAANVGAETAAMRTTVVSGSFRSQPSQKALGAGTSRTVKVPATKQAGYVQVEVFSAPVVVSAGGQAGCAPGPTDRLWIPTSDTSLGTKTTVVIANPDSDPAVVALVPHVSQGSQQAVAEVFVPPRAAVTKPFSYGQLVGLKPSIEVIAKSGRVVAGAVIVQKDKQRTYVPAQTAARTEWSFAGGLAGAARSTSVLITNPSSSPLSVSVQVSTDRGTFKPGNDFDNPVPAGAAVAVQVPPLRIGGSGAFAVRVRSRDHAEFVAALRVTTPSATGTASYVDLGTGEPDNRWLVPAVPASKRVVLANIGGDALSARLTGIGSRAGAGSTVQVGPGKVIVRELPPGAKSFEVTSDQTGLLVASLQSGLVLPGTAIGGLPPGGPVIAGPAAA